MSKLLKNITLMLALIVSGQAFGQSKTYESWKADFDARIFGSYSYDNQTGMSDYVAAALKSHSGNDMYFEGLSMIFGLTKAWQASGDFAYLDLALDIAQSDVRAASNLMDYYGTYPNGPTGNMGTFDGFPYDFEGHPAHTNYFMETDGRPWDGNANFYTNPNRGDYINNASDGGDDGTDYALYRSYGHMSIQPSNGPEGVYRSLQTSIYWRFVADMVRIIYNNDNAGSILNQNSNNGQTYQQRCDEIVNFLENEYIAMWRDHAPANPGAWFYRVNTHMASHFASISLSLYVVTGKTEYLDTLNQWLFDWGEAALSTRPDGVGFADQVRLENLGGGNGYYWANSWGSTGGYTDIGHAHAELHLLSQIDDENLGLSPPDGEPALDATFFGYITQMMKDGVLQGYTCSDGANETQIQYYINGTGGNDGLTAGSALWAIYSTDVLCHMEQQDRYNWDEIGIRAAGMYAAKVHGVNGTSAPVYPSDGSSGGTPPTNNAPTVTLVGDANQNITVGGTYTEQGATYSDFEDGTGTIATPTTGSVDVNTVADYTLTYTYTDAGGASDTATRVVSITSAGNNCPVVTSTAGTSLTLQLNDTYTEQGGTYTDVEDGSGSATVGGDVVDTSAAGNYVVTYTYVDAGGCSDVATLSVTVEDNTNFIGATSLYWDHIAYDFPVFGRIYRHVGFDSFTPPYILEPSNRTVFLPLIYSSPEGVAEPDPNLQFTPLRDGYFFATISTDDGTMLSDQMTIELIIPQTRINRAATVIMQ